MRPASNIAQADDPPQFHGCVRCGAPVPIDVSLCERCNPLGLPAPAASQAHGSIFLAIVVSVAALAIVGRLAIGGIGPFTGTVTAVVASAPGLQVSVAVHNEGSKAGASTCRIFDPSEPGIGPDAAFLLSPEVQPGATLTFTGEVTTLGPAVRELNADCR